MCHPVSTLQYEVDACFCDGDECNKNCDCADECNYVAGGNGAGQVGPRVLAAALGPWIAISRMMKA